MRAIPVRLSWFVCSSLKWEHGRPKNSEQLREAGHETRHPRKTALKKENSAQREKY